jgi:predicted dehydrogenase
MKHYTAAVIGCGGRSSPHIEAYTFIDNAAVVACCDPVEERRNERAQAFGITPYADAHVMLEKEQPDIVHITTTPTVRLDVMSVVSACSIPLCTVEKPIATGVDDWQALCDLEAASSTKFAVCHQFRWQKDFARCREAINSGNLGSVRFVDISAGMNISGQGTHILNYGMALNGDVPVARVFGAASGLSEDTVHPAPATTEGYLTFENGVRALWNTGPTAMKCGDPSTDWQHVRAAAYAENGRVNYEEFGKWEIVSPDGCMSGDFGGMAAWWQNNLLAQAAFHKAMFAWLEDENRVPGTNLKQSLHEWKVVLALYASALYRTPIDIADFVPPHDLFDQLIRTLKTNN